MTTQTGSPVNGSRPPARRSAPPPATRPPTGPTPPWGAPAPTGGTDGTKGGGGKSGKKGAAEHPAKRGEIRVGSDVLRLCEATRAHEMSGADAWREKGQETYRGIIRASNWPFGVNKRIAAVRMRRSMRKTANALELAARSAAASGKTWRSLVGSGTTIAKPSGIDWTR